MSLYAYVVTPGRDGTDEMCFPIGGDDTSALKRAHAELRNVAETFTDESRDEWTVTLSRQAVDVSQCPYCESSGECPDFIA